MHIGGKSSNALPIDPSQGKGALKTGDQAFNPSAKVPQLLKNPLALCHLFHDHAATFTKTDVLDSGDFGIKQVSRPKEFHLQPLAEPDVTVYIQSQLKQRFLMPIKSAN